LQAERWWHTPFIPALGRQKQADLRELEVSLVFRVSSRTARSTQRNPVSQSKPNKQTKTATTKRQGWERAQQLKRQAILDCRSAVPNTHAGHNGTPTQQVTTVHPHSRSQRYTHTAGHNGTPTQQVTTVHPRRSQRYTSPGVRLPHSPVAPRAPYTHRSHAYTPAKHPYTEMFIFLIAAGIVLA